MSLSALRPDSSSWAPAWRPAALALLVASACGGGSASSSTSEQTASSAGGAQPTAQTTAPAADAGTEPAGADAGEGATAAGGGGGESATTGGGGGETTTASTDADAGAAADAGPAEQPWETAPPEVVNRVQTLYPAFRRCFAAARDVATATHQSFVLNLDVNPAGHVREVHALFTASVPEARARGVIRCLEGRARTLTFPASDHGHRTQSLHNLEGSPAS